VPLFYASIEVTGRRACRPRLHLGNRIAGFCRENARKYTLTGNTGTPRGDARINESAE